MDDISWWRHQMETFSLCAGNSPVTCEFPPERPVTQSFDNLSDLCLNKRLSKYSWGWWFETPSCSLCNLVMCPRPDICLNDDIFESVFIEIDKDIFQRGKNIIIGVIYRPPGTDLPTFNDSMSLMLSGLIRENKYCYLMGDYNINLLNYENHQHTS